MFLSLKRDLALVYSYSFFLAHIYAYIYLFFTYDLDCQLLLFFKAKQAAYIAKEWVDQTLSEKKKEEAKRYDAQKGLGLIQKETKGDSDQTD